MPKKISRPEVIRARVSKQLKDRVTAYCEGFEKGEAEVVREAVREFLERRVSAAPAPKPIPSWIVPDLVAKVEEEILAGGAVDGKRSPKGKRSRSIGKPGSQA